MGQRRPLFRLFLVFSKKQYNFYNNSMCPSSIWHRDSNPQPFEHESSPITTRPGLPPYLWSLLDVSIEGGSAASFAAIKIDAVLLQKVRQL